VERFFILTIFISTNKISTITNYLKQNSMNKTFKTILFATLIASMSGCEIEPKQDLPKRSYELVWSDEFEGDKGTAINNAKWVYDLGTGQGGWGNNEQQSYTNKPENVALDGTGNLAITAIKDGSGKFTSARIKTDGIFSQQYGRIEARIKTPTGSGIWPAFWMLGSNISSVSWPQCGEIDIMEQNGKFSNITYGTIHGPGYFGGNGNSTSYAMQNNRFDSDFNLYAVEWGENYIEFFVNNYLYKRVTSSDVSGEWVFNQPFLIILNVAVGGNFVGPTNPYTPFPGIMLVDYVKVYKEK
jgi:beta-glucanase (GH16 family)